MIGLQHYLIVSALLFGLGGYCVLTRKNALGIFMGVELVLNAANVNLIAFSHFGSGTLDGQVFAVFVILLAATEAAIGLAIILAIYQNFKTIDVEATGLLKD
jgi:NADH-quinone oxidoreductase subunit K